MADIITVTEYKTYARVNSPNDDTQITMLVALVNDYVTLYCNLPSPSTTEEVTLLGGNDIALKSSPETITSIRILGAPEDLTSGTDYMYDANLGRILLSRTVVALIRSLNPERFYDGVVTFPAVPIASSLKLACLELVKYYIKGDFLQSKQVGVTRLSFSSNEDLPAHIRSVLNLNRNI